MFCERYPVENARIDFADFHLANVLISAKAAYVSRPSRSCARSYSKRWTVEPSFRDTKDLRFGLGLGAVRIADPQRRDRLLLLNAFAVVLLTLLGAAGESLGMDRHLKSNTVKTRSHSLFRQGCMLYDLTPNMPEHRLRPLVERYAELLQQSRVFTDTFALT